MNKNNNDSVRVGSLVVEFPIYKNESGKFISNMTEELSNNFYSYDFSYFDIDMNKVVTNVHYKEKKIPKPIKVIHNPPATIVFWDDGTKTVVKCQDMMHNETEDVCGGMGEILVQWNHSVGSEVFDEEKGLAMAFCKKVMGNKGSYYDMFKEWRK